MSVQRNKVVTIVRPSSKQIAKLKAQGYSITTRDNELIYLITIYIGGKIEVTYI